jgi:hypothetical protein
MAEPIAGTTGLVIDIPLLDKDGALIGLDGVLTCDLKVIPPKSKIEETWPATLQSGVGARHVVPDDKPLEGGTYKIQPYLELGSGFKGRWGAVTMLVLKTHTIV